MVQFKKISIEDRDTLAKHLSQTEHLACDYSAASLILWSSIFKTQMAVSGDRLFLKYCRDGVNYFTFPMGSGDLKEAFSWLYAYCKAQNIEMRMNNVEPNMFAEIEKIFPGRYDICYQRNYSDYIYKVEDLKNLSGKKYHGKKNHINNFIKNNPDWSYEKISDDNIDECVEMVRQWCLQNGCVGDPSKAEEVCVLIKGLRNMKELSLIGGAIRAGGRLVAVTMGERVSDEMFVVHFEKAFSDIQGAYPIINQQFIINELSGYTYVNREEDMGIEGLRKAKLSYRPVMMAEKGRIILKRQYGESPC